MLRSSKRTVEFTFKGVLNSLICASMLVGTFATPNKARADFGFLETGALSEKEILADSSSGRLDVKKARVIVDNDSAFASKIEAIRGAKKSIRLSYYIWTDDESSSVMAQELIAAANRGRKVSLLLDYHTNYIYLDLFSAMEKAGKGNIQIRFFNRPTKNIIKDSIFLTSDCSLKAKTTGGTACSNEKVDFVDRLLNGETIAGADVSKRNVSNRGTTFSKLFLSGLYSKSSTILQAAVVEGGNVNVESLKAGATATPGEDAEKLKDFASLLFKAKVKDSLIAKIQLSLAMQIYGAELLPLYGVISSLIPLEREHDENAINDWKHLTDFTHHKLLAVDDEKIQLGGRNIENSYHMKPNPLVHRYLFMDTDMYVELNHPNPDVSAAFDRLFNFSDMVATLAEVRAHAPNDMIQNPVALQTAIGLCADAKKVGFEAYDSCVATRFEQLPKVSLEERMAAAMAKMQKNADVYKAQYKPVREQTWKQAGTKSDELDTNDIANMTLTYIENLPFRKDRDLKRAYGSEVTREAKSGKYIHSLMIQSLRNVCKASEGQSERARVIFHQGYVLLPSNLMMTLASMLNGEWDCRNVDVVFLTNSVETTDLSIVNFFARHQLKSLVDFARDSKSDKKARIRILEYLKPADGANQSLHSKVNVIGDDVIIGSANADVRSYYMDTNNGFFMRGAKSFAREYGAMVGRLAADSTRVRDLGAELLAKSHEQMMAEDRVAVREFIAKRDQSGKLKGPLGEMLISKLLEIQTHVYQASEKFLDASKVVAPYARDANDVRRVQLEEQLREGNDFNLLFQLF